MESKEFYINSCKYDIAKICKYLCSKSNHRIEYEDLFSEATLKILELYRDRKVDNPNYGKNFIIQSVKNHLINYVKKNSQNNVINTELINSENTCVAE